MVVDKSGQRSECHATRMLVIWLKFLTLCWLLSPAWGKQFIVYWCWQAFHLDLLSQDFRGNILYNSMWFDLHGAFLILPGTSGLCLCIQSNQVVTVGHRLAVIHTTYKHTHMQFKLWVSGMFRFKKIPANISMYPPKQKKQNKTIEYRCLYIFQEKPSFYNWLEIVCVSNFNPLLNVLAKFDTCPCLVNSMS